MVGGKKILSFIEAQQVIQNIGNNAKVNISNREIQQNVQEPLASLLIRLNGNQIAPQRNKVVHQRAYRPSREKVIYFWEEAKDIIGELESILDVNDDVNYYMG